MSGELPSVAVSAAFAFRDERAAAALRRFGALTRRQREILALLNDGPDEDSVGLEAEELDRHQILVCERLAGRDLVRFDIGWRHSCWFRLTSAGREALRQFPAPKRATAAARGAGNRASGARNRTRARPGNEA